MRFLRRNVLWVYAVYAGALLSGLVVPPILLHTLGSTELGIWLFIGSLTGYLRVLDLGVGPSIVRFGAKHRGERDEEATNALLSVGLVVYALIGAATIVLGVVLAYLVPELVDVPPDLVWTARAAGLVVVATIAVDFLIGIFSDLLGAQQRYDVINVCGLVSIVLYVVLIATVLRHTGGLVLLAAIVFVTTVVRLALPLLWVPRELPFLRPSRRYVTRERVRGLLGFSWHNFLIHVAARAAYGTDLVVVGIVLGSTAAAVYGLPSKLFAMGFGLATAAPALIYPAVAEAEGARDRARQRHYLRGGLRVGMSLMLLVALPLVLIPHDCLVAWGIGSGTNRLDAHQLHEASLVLALLGVALVLSQPLDVAGKFLVARGRPAPMARILLASVALNVVVSVALAETVGVWGVAVGTIAGQVGALLVVPVLVSRASEIPVRALAVSALRPVLPAVVTALLLFGVVQRWHPDTKTELLPVAVTWLAAGAIAIWFLGLDGSDRAAIRRNAGRRKPADPALAEPIV